jgi:hypothetical protein
MEIIIAAKSAEDFKKIEDALKTLPTSVSNQISKASKEGLIGIECVIKDKYGESKAEIYLPKGTTQISDFGNYKGVYCGEFFFRIQGDLYKKQHTFRILQD